MLEPLAQIEYRTHSAMIFRNPDRDSVLCWKHNDAGRCDLQIFHREDLDSISDWIVEDLPQGGWYFEFDDDSSE